MKSALRLLGLAAVLVVVLVLCAAGARASSPAPPPRPLPWDLNRELGPPRKQTVEVEAGLVFRCWYFIAREGYVKECVLVGRVKPKRARPVGPGA